MNSRFYMKNNFFNGVCLFLCVQASCALQAEYLVCSRTNASELVPASESQYWSVFPLLQKYQFPMSLAHIGQLRQELSTRALEELAAHEHAFIQEKVKSIDPSIELVFIPATLWEVIAIRNLALNVYNFLQKNEPTGLFSIGETTNSFLSPYYKLACSALDKMGTYSLPKIPTYVGPSDDQSPEKTEANYPGLTHYLECYERRALVAINVMINKLQSDLNEENNLLLIQSFDWGMRLFNWNERISQVINDRLTSYIQWLFNTSIAKYYLYVVQEKHDIDNIIAQLVQDIRNLETRMPALRCCLKQLGMFGIHDRFDIHACLKKCIGADVEAYEKGYFTLYRGTNGFEGRLDKIIGKQHLSFGNSLCAGFLYDSAGSSSCALYAMYLYCITYGLHLPKRDFLVLQDSFLSRFFQMKPLGTIASLISSGESFHPRMFSRPDIQFEDKAKEAQFQKLLSSQARIVWNRSNISDESLLSDFNRNDVEFGHKKPLSSCLYDEHKEVPVFLPSCSPVSCAAQVAAAPSNECATVARPMPTAEPIVTCAVQAYPEALHRATCVQDNQKDQWFRDTKAQLMASRRQIDELKRQSQNLSVYYSNMFEHMEAENRQAQEAHGRRMKRYELFFQKLSTK